MTKCRQASIKQAYILSLSFIAWVMFRSDFPDIVFLKNMIARIERQGGEWPNVIINTTTRQSHRPDIKGTLSIFSNIKGYSYCTVDGRKLRVEEDHYFISNKDQEYTLDIDATTAAETFNIHFATSMLDEYMCSLENTNERMLDHTGVASGLVFHNKLYQKDENFSRIIQVIRHNGHAGLLTDLMTDELLSELLHQLLHQQQAIRRQVASIYATKAATREEIYNRLSIATDYIHSLYFEDIALDDLAAVACMSRFHFLRLFKELHHTTPHRYITVLRMKKAAALLKKTSLGISEIASLVGYDDAGSFARVFFQYYKHRPLAFRGLVRDAI